MFPTFQPWAGDQWLEEDCDWCLAALAFPDIFEPRSVYHAVETASKYGADDAASSSYRYFCEARWWLEHHPAAQAVKAIAARYYESTMPQAGPKDLRLCAFA
ncbi:MAG: hypothetical protein KGL39_36920 [Patescibacteria group bacterium]|nr:hypothetical protein [Patescibacteria group bacterium]